VVVAVLALAGGVVLAATGAPKRAGPAATVLGYFAALQRGDAGAALGFGVVPKGPRQLLSPAVLAQQQAIAPISEVTVLAVRSSGARAVVRVQYLLSFADGQRLVSTRLRLRRSGTWRLERTAVRARLRVAPAGERATLVGAAVPHHPMLLFPGAAPIRFDSVDLAVGPSDGVTFGAHRPTVVRAVVSRTGRLAAIGAVTAALHDCLSPTNGQSASGNPACPLPPGRYVPGSVRGAPLGPPANHLHVRLAPSPAGVLEVTGRVRVRAHYRRLTFRNQVVAGRGRVTLPVRARGYAGNPLRLRWAR
jgi:hypothetical protein